MPPRAPLLHRTEKPVERIFCERAMKFFISIGRKLATEHRHCRLTARGCSKTLWIHQLQQHAKARCRFCIDRSVDALSAKMALECGDNRCERNVDLWCSAVTELAQHLNKHRLAFVRENFVRNRMGNNADAVVCKCL